MRPQNKAIARLSYGNKFYDPLGHEKGNCVYSNKDKDNGLYCVMWQ